MRVPVTCCAEPLLGRCLRLACNPSAARRRMASGSRQFARVLAAGANSYARARSRSQSCSEDLVEIDRGHLVDTAVEALDHRRAWSHCSKAQMRSARSRSSWVPSECDGLRRMRMASSIARTSILVRSLPMPNSLAKDLGAERAACRSHRLRSVSGYRCCPTMSLSSAMTIASRQAAHRRDDSLGHALAAVPSNRNALGARVDGFQWPAGAGAARSAPRSQYLDELAVVQRALRAIAATAQAEWRTPNRGRRCWRNAIMTG